MNSTFESNNGIYGGAIHLGAINGPAKVINSKFTNNTADAHMNAIAYGGAIYVDSLDVLSDNLDFNDNMPTTQGGAIYVHEKSAYNMITNVIINNSRFNNNRVGGTYSYGGAIFTIALDEVMVKFLKAEIVKTAKILRKNIKEGKGLPKSIKMNDSKNKTHTLKITEYLGVFQQRNIFILKNGRAPNYVQLNSTCSTLPIAMNYQDTLNKINNTNQLHKTYYAFTTANLKKEDKLVDYLKKDSKTNTSYVTTSKEGKLSILTYNLIDKKENLNLVKINLLTGRSHQIRVQFASRNNPLVGDQKYNPKEKSNTQIALFAQSITFPHPITKEQLTYTLPLPNRYPFNIFK